MLLTTEQIEGLKKDIADILCSPCLLIDKNGNCTTGDDRCDLIISRTNKIMNIFAILLRYKAEDFIKLSKNNQLLEELKAPREAILGLVRKSVLLNDLAEEISSKR